MTKPFNPDCWYRKVCENYKEGCQTHCARYIKMRYLMAHSRIPVNKCVPIALYPDACDRKAFERLADIKDDIDEWVANGKSLYITSEHVGNGKTAWAIKMMLKYFEYIWSDTGFDICGVYVYVPAFLLKCKDFNQVDNEFEELKRLLFEVDLVIWDDIACTDVSAFDLEQLSAYIDYRNLSELSNIYTGNLPCREDLEQALGTRLTSRILGRNTEVIELRGGDRR